MQTSDAPFALSPADQRRFDDEGYIILKEIIPLRQVEQGRQALAQLVDAEAQRLLQTKKITDPLLGEPFETRLFRLYENHLDEAPQAWRNVLHKEGLYGFFYNQRLLDIVEGFLGQEIRLYPNYSCRPKFPEAAQHLILWHQDAAYTKDFLPKGSDVSEKQIADLRMINVWSPLVPARVENGCMQFIPGTHKLGLVPHTKEKFYLQIADEWLRPRLAEAIDVEMDPGDVVLFSNLLFHQGQPNRSRSIRWTLDWRYQDAAQPTLRRFNGHMVRSRLHPETVVKNEQAWAAIPQEYF